MEFLGINLLHVALAFAAGCIVWQFYGKKIVAKGEEVSNDVTTTVNAVPDRISALEDAIWGDLAKTLKKASEDVTLAAEQVKQAAEKISGDKTSG